MEYYLAFISVLSLDLLFCVQEVFRERPSTDNNVDVEGL
jgi:hypothetical protein